MLKEVEQIHRTVPAYGREGRGEAARALLAEEKEKRARRRMLGAASRSLRRIRERTDRITRSQDMTPEDKRAASDRRLAERARMPRQAVFRREAAF